MDRLLARRIAARSSAMPALARRVAVALALALAFGAPAGAPAAAGSPSDCDVRDVADDLAAYPDLASALAAVADGGMLEVRGRCVVVDLAIDRPVTIVGVATPEAGTARLVGDRSGRLLRTSALVYLRDLLLLHGRTTGDAFPDYAGGSILVEGGRLVLRDVRITDSAATDGDSSDGDLSSGGGVAVIGGATLVLAGASRIDHARAAWGGAISVEGRSGTTLVLRDDARLDHDRATYGGGAIGALDDGGTIMLRDDVSLDRDRAGLFGAAINAGGRIVIRDRVRVHRNDSATAPMSGAIEVWAYGDARAHLRLAGRATVTGNRAGAGGGGVVLWQDCGRHAPTIHGGPARVVGNLPADVTLRYGTSGC